MKVLGYVRVSSIEQSFGTSLDDQARAIRDCAKARKLPAPKIFREVISGKNKSRPQFDALMQSAEKGDWVFCVHVDRWGRDLVKIVTSTDELSAKGVRVHFINNAIDAWTDGGKLQLRYIAVGAEAEHASIRRRMVGTRQLLRNQGFFIEGHVTFGYKRPHAPGYKGPNKNVLDVHETNG
ncbi:MAG TPA: recombinase family protein, partial [Polyangiaceae bacterium]